MFDEYGAISPADERPRLDDLAVQLQREPGYIVYLVVYAGRRACVGDAQARAVRAKNYLVNRRGVQADRIIWIDGGYREEETVSILLQPRSATIPYAAPTVAANEVRVIRNCRRRNRSRFRSL